MLNNSFYKKKKYLISLKNIFINDSNIVGGKNASLGEMLNKLKNINILIPKGFVTTSYAFKKFLNKKIKKITLKEKILFFLKNINFKNIKIFKKIGFKIRKFILNTPFTYKFKKKIFFFYKKFKKKFKKISFAVRSSSTLEDLKNASFAGQQETFLNINGINNIYKTIKLVFSSLYNNRAILYRKYYKFNKNNFYISVCIQQMIRSDLGISGVMFTLDTESGFEDVILITSNYGLGETIVRGIVDPDEFYVHKTTLKKNKFPIIQRNIGSKLLKMNFNNYSKNFKNTIKIIKTNSIMQKKYSLTDKEIIKLSKLALIIEKHYKCQMDIEWSIDGLNKKIYILQARPETIKSQQKNIKIQKKFQFIKKNNILMFGKAIGQNIGFGRIKIINNFSDSYLIKKGDILVTDITNPNWELIMKKTSAIITNRGGKTCHAAIIARELGIPAIVGCKNATKILKKNKIITVSCIEGEEGIIYDGLLNIKFLNLKQKKKIKFPFKIMMNIGNPKMAFEFSSIPNNGIGLTRLEFIINNYIKIHPKVILEYPKINKNLKKIVDLLIQGYSSPLEYYKKKLIEGISTIASTFWPKLVIIRFSDFKSNEYKKLLGGKYYEPKEENPMLGFRGVTRYLSKDFLKLFLLECNIIKKIRNTMGLTNIQIMIPFIRTLKQANKIINLLKLNNLRRFKNGLKIIMMCEIPSNILLANFFLNKFDGFSIGSNDLTQLTLALDRDSGINSILKDFNEENFALKKEILKIIKICKKNNKYIGICGQGPSDNIFFTKWLINKNINSISLNPDSIINILELIL